MTRIATLTLIAAGFLAGSAAPAAAQGLPSSTLDTIKAGAQSCAAATTSAGVDANRLKVDGWRPATMSNDGKPVATELSFYGRGGLLLMLDAKTSQPACVFAARIASVAEFPKLQAAMVAAYGAPVKDDGKGEQILIAPDHRIVDLASTGSNERPAVRVAVGPVFQETK